MPMTANRPPGTFGARSPAVQGKLYGIVGIGGMANITWETSPSLERSCAVPSIAIPEWPYHDSSRKPPESQHSGARAQATPMNHFPLARFVGEVFCNSANRGAADAGAVTLPEWICSPVTFFP